MKVAIYVRVSTQRQALTQTIEQQIQILSEYSQAQHWPWQEEFIFRDDGYSGAILRRPGLDRLRDQVRCAAFDRVLITAPDRLARNYVHQMLLVEEFERGGCQVEFADRPMSQDPHDQLLLQIRGAVAEYERSLIAERMRRGRRQKYQAGALLPWTCPPYGYRVDPTRPRDPAGVRLEPTEVAVVADLFVSYLQEGQSLKKVTDHLMELQVPTPSRRTRWNQATVRGILTNPVYTGTVYLGRSRPVQARQRHSALQPIGRDRGGHTQTAQEEWVAVTQVPAIVSQEQFDRIQAKLAQNQQFARRNNTAYPYLLRALVSCGTCRLACTGRSSHGGYAYYVCNGRHLTRATRREEKCPARTIPVEQLDELVWQDVCLVLTHPQQIAEALAQAQGGQWLPQALQARRENLRKARLSVEQQMERLTDAYLAKVLDLDEYKRRRQELEQRLQAVAGQVRQLEISMQRHDELSAMVQSIETFCQRVTQGLAEATFEQKRQLIELLFDRVVVTGEEVEIRYVIPTSPQSEQIRFCHLRLDYFNPPVAANCVGKRFHRGETEQEVAGMLGDFLLGIDAPFGSHHPDAAQAFPPFLRVEIGQDLGITDGPVLPDLEPTVTFLHLALRLPLQARKGILLSQRKGGLHLIVQVLLVLFEGQSILPLLLDNLPRNLGLGAHRINGNNAARQGSLP
ncbi:MAG: recombinase family protein [Ktedonobacteraceae bacterium]